MNFWLILKQSVRSFYSKIGLYVTFTIFLIISLALIVGLFGFSYGFNQYIRDSLGHIQLNQQYNFSSAYVPTWVMEDQGSEERVLALDPAKHYWEREESHLITNFLAQEFPDQLEFPSVPQDLAHPQNSQQLTLALVSLGVGYSYGNLFPHLAQNDIYNSQLLYHYFSSLTVSSSNPLDENERIETNLRIFNKFVDDNYPQFSDRHFTHNLGLAIFLKKFQEAPHTYQIASSFHQTKDFYSRIYTQPAVTVKYQRLNPNSNLVHYRPDLLETTPQVLFAHSSEPFNIVQELNASQLAAHQDFIDSFRYTYVSPKFLQKSNLALGDKITLYYQNDRQQSEPLDFLIVGTMAESHQFNGDGNPNFTIPYQWAQSFQIEENNRTVNLAQSFAPFNMTVRVRNAQYNNDIRSAQKGAANQFMDYFRALKTEDEPRFYRQLADTSWTVNSLQSSYDMLINLFYVLASVMSILLVVLLFVVFYFITREIINMERNTLFYLKAMGVYNSSLSLLTTFALIVPVLIGIVGGLFGALAIQKMISNIVLEPTVLNWHYFTFNFPFALTLVISILVIFIGFYAINFRFLKSPALVSDSAKKPSFLSQILINTKLRVDKHLTRGTRLRLAFAFKNIYKNIVTFFILAVTFGLILYIVQFQSSLTSIARAYEKWNQPYKSVLYQPELAPIIGDDSEYNQSYQVITPEEVGQLTPIKSVAQLRAVITDYLGSLSNSTSAFNWKNYYFDQNFTKMVLDRMGPNPSDKVINDWIDEFYPQANYQIRGQIIAIVRDIVEQNNSLKEEFGYDQGYNVFFARLVAPQTLPHRNVLTLRSYYPDRGSRRIKTILFENDEASRMHFGFGSETTADNYIKRGTFVVRQNSLLQPTIAIQDPLRVNISSYLQTNYDIKVGDVVPLRLMGLKTDETFDGFEGDNSALVYAYVNDVVRGDTIENTFFTSQIGVLNYLAQGNHQIPEDKEFLANQQEYYQNLLSQVEEHNIRLSNTVFTNDSEIPWGIRNITLPFYAHTDSNKELGSRIEDFYSQRGDLQKYLGSFEDNITIFRLITAALNSRTEQFISVLWRFVVILTLFALIISLLLVTLILLENRRVISVLKALGYRRGEITSYLISGYLLSTILAVIGSIGLSFLAFFLTRRPISRYLGMSVYYLFSWQFFLLAIVLGVIFAGIMAISIAIFTRYQNPKNAFVAN